MNEFWNKVIEQTDGKYIDEAVEMHIRNAPELKTLKEIKPETAEPEKPWIRIIKTAGKIAAALAVIIGIGTAVRLTDFNPMEGLKEITAETDGNPQPSDNESTRLMNISYEYLKDYSFGTHTPVIYLDNTERCFFSLGDGSLLIYNLSLRGIESASDIMGTIKSQYGYSYDASTAQLKWYAHKDNVNEPCYLIISYENENGGRDSYGISFADYSAPHIEKADNSNIYSEYSKEKLGYEVIVESETSPYAVGNGRSGESGFLTYLQAKTDSVYSLEIIRTAGSERLSYYVFGNMAEAMREAVEILQPPENYLEAVDIDSVTPQIISCNVENCWFRVGDMLYVYNRLHDFVCMEMDILHTASSAFGKGTYEAFSEANEYTDEYGKEYIIVRLDNGKTVTADYYMIDADFSEYTAMLRYIPDMSVYKDCEINKSLTVSETSVDGRMIQLRDDNPDAMALMYASLSLNGSSIYDLAINYGDNSGINNTVFPFKDREPKENADPKTVSTVDCIISEPTDDFLNSCDLNKAVPRLYEVIDDTCWFGMDNKVIYAYNMKTDTLEVKLDVAGTLSDRYDIRYIPTQSDMTLRFYLVDNKPYGVISFKRTDGTCDNFLLGLDNLQAPAIKYTDSEAVNNLPLYNETTGNGIYNGSSYPYIYMHNDNNGSMLYLRNSGLMSRQGGYGTEIVYNTGSELLRYLPFDISKEKTAASVSCTAENADIGFADSYNIDSYPPNIIFTGSAVSSNPYSVIQLSGGRILIYGLKEGRLLSILDIPKTLSEKYGLVYDPDTMQARVYGNNYITVSLKRKTEEITDNFLITADFDGYSLTYSYIEYIPDISAYEDFTKDGKLSHTEKENCYRNIIASNGNNSAYLYESNDPLRSGLYKMQIVWDYPDADLFGAKYVFGDNSAEKSVYNDFIPPKKDFLENCNISEGTVKLLYYNGSLCMFTLSRDILCIFNTETGRMVTVDMLNTLNTYSEIYYKGNSLTNVYVDKNGDEHIIMKLKRIDNGKWDNYYISVTEDRYLSAAAIENVSVFEEMTKYSDIRTADDEYFYFALDGRAAYSGSNCFYLKNSGSEMRKGAYGIEIICMTDGEETRPSYFPFAEGKMITATNGEGTTESAVSTDEIVASVNRYVENATLSDIENYDLDAHPPRIVHATSTSCTFSLYGGLLYTCQYNGFISQLDIIGTLKKFYNLDYEKDTMEVSIFASKNEELDMYYSQDIVYNVRLTRTDRSTDDFYKITLSTDGCTISAITDWSIFDGMFMYDTLVPADSFSDSISENAAYDGAADCYTYIRKSSLEYRKGIDRTEIVWSFGKDDKSPQTFLPFGSYPTENRTAGEPASDSYEDANPPGSPVTKSFIYDGKEYLWALYDYSFTMDEDGNIMEASGIDPECDYYLLKDGTLSETLSNINQLEEITPDEYLDEKLKGIRFYRYGYSGGIISVHIGSKVQIPKKNPSGTVGRVPGYTCNARLHSLYDYNVNQDIFIGGTESRKFNIDFLDDSQNAEFNSLFGLLSGTSLNHTLPMDESRKIGGYYLTDEPYYAVRIHFDRAFIDNSICETIPMHFGFANINGCIAWKPYSVNPKYENYKDISFRLIEKSKKAIRFSAVVDFGDKTEEFTYEMTPVRNGFFDITYFECWDGTTYGALSS